MIIKTTLKKLTDEVMSQRQVAKQLNLTPAAISIAISRGHDIQVTYDDKSLSIVDCYKIVPFGVLHPIK